MANYTKATNFATKDTLPTGDSGKIVKGTEIDSELNAIASAISSKADTASPTFTGTPAAPTAASGTNTTQLATTAFVQEKVSSSISAAYPVGSIYLNATNSTNPGTLLGFGTWAAFGAGRMLVGFNASDSLFDTAEETGGSKDAITVSHTHTFSATTSTQDKVEIGIGYTQPAATPSPDISVGVQSVFSASGYEPNSATDVPAHSHTVSGTTSSTGSSGTNANLPPYITVYIWKRTA
jgi:hypothetical protein